MTRTESLESISLIAMRAGVLLWTEQHHFIPMAGGPNLLQFSRAPLSALARTNSLPGYIPLTSSHMA